ncbi:MAG: CAP domain-containing protein [Novosphingobium sp.]|uniref:CAP domain-containing protein n=1 Tax=Novosphingobium sp. TaxID=1874826 RepID=UPI0032B9A040
MKKIVAIALLAGLLAAPIAALVPFNGVDGPSSDLTRKKKKRAAPLAKPSPTPAPTVAVPVVDPQSFNGRVLGSHNSERKRMGIAPLIWNAALASQAGSWAQSLAAKGIFEHSRGRGNVGENLWMGTSGYYAPEAMIGAFVDEKQYFRPGKFPDVSSTGKWADVGHYTQLIWPGTREVGCAKATGNGRDVLVCRYAPAGNVIGQQVP